ncbi:MAG: protease complex subunit PrcB family protein [Planctomycetota bacterium]
MNKRVLTTSGILAMGVLALAAGCKTAAPAESSAATAEPVAPTVDVSHVTPLKLKGTAAAEMGGPEQYALKLITSADDLPAAVLEQGLDVDFEVHDVVLLGMGTQPTSGYGATITAVQQVGHHLFVQASFTQPAPDALVNQVVTQPWAAATIYKRKPGVTLLSDFD